MHCPTKNRTAARAEAKRNQRPIGEGQARKKTGDDEPRMTKSDRRQDHPIEGQRTWNRLTRKRGLSRVGSHGEKTRDGCYTPTPESMAVGPVSPRESQERQGGDERMRAAKDEGGTRSIKKFAGNDRGQAGRSGNTEVPQDNTTSEVAEDTKAESTNVDVEGSMYLIERVCGAERNEERAMWPRKGGATSTKEINAEIRHAAVPNRGIDQRATTEDKEGQTKGATTYGTSFANSRGEDRKDRLLVNRMEPVVRIEKMGQLEVEKKELRRTRGPDRE